MRPRLYRVVFAVCLFAIISGVTAPVRADSLPIPGIRIAVNRPPEDLKIEFLLADGKWYPGSKYTDPWDTYFEYSDWELDKNIPGAIRASYAGQSVQIALPQVKGGYAYLYGLDLKTQILTPYKLPPLAFTLALPRLAVTILCEGIVFFLFGFRQLRSWIIFVGVNILTQGMFNIFLYDIRVGEFGLILLIPFIELVIIAIETSVIAIRVREQSVMRRILCPILANIASFLLSFVVANILPM